MSHRSRLAFRRAWIPGFALLAACGASAGTSNAPLVSDAPGSTAGSSGSSARTPTTARTGTPPPDTLATFTPPGGGAVPVGDGAGGPAPARGARPTGVPGTNIRFTGGDGGAVERAIVIEGAHGESDGTASEYQYLELLLGPRGQGWRMRQQALLSHDGHQFDRLDIVRADGGSESFYFDITAYFGR